MATALYRSIGVTFANWVPPIFFGLIGVWKMVQGRSDESVKKQALEFERVIAQARQAREERLAMFNEAMKLKPGTRTDLTTNSSKDAEHTRNTIHGTTRAYSIERVKKECEPDVVAKVMSGEMSPNAALVKAGIRENRKQKIFDLWLACWTEQEIVDAVGCAKGDVNRSIPQNGNIAEMGKTQQSAADHATDFEVPERTAKHRLSQADKFEAMPKKTQSEIRNHKTSIELAT